MSRKIKTTVDDVASDDTTNPFWQSILNNPDYPKFEQDLKYIIDQSIKHNQPFNDIDPDGLNSYDWKL